MLKPITQAIYLYLQYHWFNLIGTANAEEIMMRSGHGGGT